MSLRVKIQKSYPIDGHVEYDICVKENGFQWTVSKRYNDFLSLDEHLKKLPVRHRLPAKGLIGFRHLLRFENYMSNRQHGLEAYLKAQLHQIANLTGENFADEVRELILFLSADNPPNIAPAVNTFRPSQILIRAEDAEELDIECADTIGLLGFEVFMGNLPAANSGVFGIACVLDTLNEADLPLLTSTLRQMLTVCPHWAGRVKRRALALSNSGVNFTVVHVDESCPKDLPHDQLFDFCDVCEPSSIMAGEAPLLTVKVSIHTDGAVLGVTASHCLMDGSSLFGFLNSWGKLCRGHAHGLRGGMEGASRAPLRHLLKRDLRANPEPGVWETTANNVNSFLHGADDNMAAIVEKAGKAINRSAASIATSAVVAIVPRMIGGQNSRIRLVIPSEKLSSLKVAATPPPEASGDGWVSTQEAVVAHLLLSLWNTFMVGKPVKNGGCACVSFYVDVRRCLGLADNFYFGTGFQVVDLHIKDMNSKTLSQCASDVHEGSRALPELAKQKWHLWHHAFEDRVRLERFVRDSVSQRSSDMAISINNNSKRDVPDFGPAGGKASALMSSMGPTLLLSTRHGLEVILEHDLFATASAEKQEDFRKAFHQIP